MKIGLRVRTSFPSALSFSPIYFNCITRHTPNGVKGRGKQSLHFNKVGVKSHNSKNEGEPLEFETGARTSNFLMYIQLACITIPLF